MRIENSKSIGIQDFCFFSSLFYFGLVFVFFTFGIGFFTSSVFAAQIKDAQADSELTYQISAFDLNRIKAVGDRIKSIKMNEGAFEVIEEADFGEIYIRPSVFLPDTTQVMYVITEKGYTYKLTLVSKKIPSEQLFIQSTDIEGNIDGGNQEEKKEKTEKRTEEGIEGGTEGGTEEESETEPFCEHCAEEAEGIEVLKEGSETGIEKGLEEEPKEEGEEEWVVVVEESMPSVLRSKSHSKLNSKLNSQLGSKLKPGKRTEIKTEGGEETEENRDIQLLQAFQTSSRLPGFEFNNEFVSFQLGPFTLKRTKCLERSLKRSLKHSLKDSLKLNQGVSKGVNNGMNNGVNNGVNKGMNKGVSKGSKISGSQVLERYSLKNPFNREYTIEPANFVFDGVKAVRFEKTTLKPKERISVDFFRERSRAKEGTEEGVKGRIKERMKEKGLQERGVK